MKIAVASDHRGVTVKAKVLDTVLGTNDSDTSVDYPDFAAVVAGGVSGGEYDRGVLICGSGIGMCIVANKFDRVRAAPVHDQTTAEMSRRHNNSNILCLSADMIGEDSLTRMIETWLNTEFDGGRHERRIDKITSIEDTRGTS